MKGEFSSVLTISWLSDAALSRCTAVQIVISKFICLVIQIVIWKFMCSLHLAWKIFAWMSISWVIWKSVLYFQNGIMRGWGVKGEGLQRDEEDKISYDFRKRMVLCRVGLQICSRMGSLSGEGYSNRCFGSTFSDLSLR